VNGNRPLNGLGEKSGWQDASGQWHESFTPTYDSFFPEYFLSALQTETLVHDLSTEPSQLGGSALHGRTTHPDGGAAPTYWITEVNLSPASGPVSPTSMSAGDVGHVAAKDSLRYLASYVNKGVTALYFYAAQAGSLSLVAPSFFDAVKSAPSTYPGDSRGGEATAAISRLVGAMDGAKSIASPRSLSLKGLTDYSGNVQFQGNGTAAYPPLFNRDVFGFFPFQVNAHRFVVPVYVMTRNVVKEYKLGSSSPTRFDMPPEPYGLQIAGVDGRGAEVTATDPLTGDSVPVEVLAGDADSLTVKLGVTDSPRLLTIQEASSDPEPGGDEGDPDPTPEDPGPSPEPPDGDPGPTPEDPGPPFELPGDPPQGPSPDGNDSSGPEPGPGHGQIDQPGADAPGGKSRATDSPSVRLTLRSRATLLRSGHLTARVNCSQACVPNVKGEFRIAGRVLPMRPIPSRTNRRLLGSETRAVVELGAAGPVARRVRGALEQGQRVTVAVAAYVGASEASPAATRTLVLAAR
jgi:hypothetical protein